MSMPTEQQMRAAIASHDRSSDGRFIYALISTGVFCHPSCCSRSAHPDNLCFFADVETAMSAGFRPCKRCQPAATGNQLTRLVEIARYIEAQADQKLTLSILADQAGLSPSRLQRVFKQAFGVSPKAYQDAVRMRRMKQALQQGSGVTDAIFTAGYGSVSRVYGEVSRSIGMSPKSYRAGGAGETIAHACRITALGPMLMAATDKGVCFVEFGDDQVSLLAKLQQEFSNARLIESKAQQSAELDRWIEALDEHISQGSARPDLPLDLRGTAFQIKVWRFLLSVREAQVLSYSELAQRIDKPKAVRAVASACGANRIGVLIPCHRVLRSDGGLGGYRGGLERKRALLDAERSRSDK